MAEEEEEEEEEEMRIRLQPHRRLQGKRFPGKLHISLLSLPANERSQRLAKLPVATAAAATEENASVVNRWCQLQDTVQSTALVVLCHAATAPLLSANGSTLLTEMTQILQPWAEVFRGVLNRPTTIARLPQMDTNVDLDLPPSLCENIRAVQQISSRKASGSDASPAEIYKHGGSHLMDHLIKLLQEMNIFARILLNRLNNHLEQGLLPESQCGFRRHRETTDTSFAARQLQEKCQEIRTHLYSTFVDLTKAFDTVNHEGLWKIIQKFGCLE
nr:unnamed protein product [Spirometra erinaceieuropaei]